MINLIKWFEKVIYMAVDYKFNFQLVALYKQLFTQWSNL